MAHLWYIYPSLINKVMTVKYLDKTIYSTGEYLISVIDLFNYNLVCYKLSNYNIHSIRQNKHKKIDGELFMIKKFIYLCVLSLVATNFALANECPHGKLLGFDDASEFVAMAGRGSPKQYNSKQSRFIKDVRARQIRKTFDTDTVAEAFASVDEGVIFKFEIKGSELTAYDYLTVIYAHQGDTLVGLVFQDNSSTEVAKLSDGDIQICEPDILN